MKIIDTHHHLWDLENNRYPWLVEPVDLHHSDNPPSHPELLEVLTATLKSISDADRARLAELLQGVD